VVTCSGRDLVEEYLACGIWPLGCGWFVGPVVRRDFAGFLKQILSHAFVVDLGDRSWDIFVAETEKEAEYLVGPVIEHEVDKGIEPRGYDVHLNRVFRQIGLHTNDTKVRPKRRRTPTSVFALS
jgi:hypothetical protein